MRWIRTFWIEEGSRVWVSDVRVLPSLAVSTGGVENKVLCWPFCDWWWMVTTGPPWSTEQTVKPPARLGKSSKLVCCLCYWCYLQCWSCFLPGDVQKHGAFVGCSDGCVFMNSPFNFRGSGGGGGPKCAAWTRLTHLAFLWLCHSPSPPLSLLVILRDSPAQGGWRPLLCASPWEMGWAGALLGHSSAMLMAPFPILRALRTPSTEFSSFL